MCGKCEVFRDSDEDSGFRSHFLNPESESESLNNCSDFSLARIQDSEWLRNENVSESESEWLKSESESELFRPFRFNEHH